MGARQGRFERVHQNRRPRPDAGAESYQNYIIDEV